MHSKQVNGNQKNVTTQLVKAQEAILLLRLDHQRYLVQAGRGSAAWHHRRVLSGHVLLGWRWSPRASNAGQRGEPLTRRSYELLPAGRWRWLRKRFLADHRIAGSGQESNSWHSFVGGIEALYLPITLQHIDDELLIAPCPWSHIFVVIQLGAGLYVPVQNQGVGTTGSAVVLGTLCARRGGIRKSVRRG